MTNYRLSLLFIALATAGCDGVWGLRTDAELQAPAKIDCIDQSIRRIPDIGKVSYRLDEFESSQILPYRGKVITVSHHWSYGPAERGSVQILDDGSKRTYSNGMERMGEPYPPAELDRFSPMMVKVNLALERQCDLPIATKGRVSRN